MTVPAPDLTLGLVLWGAAAAVMLTASAVIVASNVHYWWYVDKGLDAIIKVVDAEEGGS